MKTIDDAELFEYINSLKPKATKTKQVDVASLESKLRNKVRAPRTAKKKETTKKIAAGKVQSENVAGDFSFDVLYAPSKIKPKVVVGNDYEFDTVPKGRSKVVDASRNKNKNKISAEEFAEIEETVAENANLELEERRKRIRAKKLRAIKEAEEAALEEERLHKEEIKKARLSAKLRKVVKTETREAEERLNAEIAADADLVPAILDDDYPGENSRSSAKKLRRMEAELDDEDDANPFSTPRTPITVGSGITIDDKTFNALNSMFGERSSSILELLDTDNSDGALSLIMKTLLKTLVDVLPVIEKYVRSSNGTKGVYQFTQLTSQLRETCADIQAYRDRANLGNTVVDRYVRPSFLDIAVQITSTWVEMENQARTLMSPENYALYAANTLTPLKRGIAEYLRKQYEEISASVVQALN